MSFTDSLKSQIQEMPNTPGVYLFYPNFNQAALPLYIGKSTGLKKRVLSHCYQAKSCAQEHKLMSQVKRIDWQQTTGEVGALLLESSLIKKFMPVYNKRLRRSKYCVFIRLRPIHDFLIPSYERQLHVSIVPDERAYGLFRTQRQASQWLEQVIKEEQLCRKVLGLEKTWGCCFAHHLKKCRGACVDGESAASHNSRLLRALSFKQQASWPYPGRIALIEPCYERAQKDIHIIHNWRYLGSHTLSITDSIQPEGAVDAEFDLDQYKILCQALYRKDVIVQTLDGE